MLDVLDNLPVYPVTSKFIVVEGVDGSGKTSLVDFLVQNLNVGSRDSIEVLRQPGSTILGGKVREMIKSVQTLDPRVMHLLMEAARLDLLLRIEEIRTMSGVWFICDRHIDSTWAYQGTDGVPDRQISSVQSIYLERIKPDLTIYLDVTPEMAMKRSQAREVKDSNYDLSTLPAMEARLAMYNRRVTSNRKHYFVVDANRPQEQVQKFVLENLKFERIQC